MNLKQENHDNRTLCQSFEARHTLCKSLWSALSALEFIGNGSGLRRECRLLCKRDIELGRYSCSRRIPGHGRICVEGIFDDGGHVLIHFKDKVEERLHLIYNDSLVVSMQVDHDL